MKVGERIRIKFGDFDIEDSDSCHFNYLRLFNGIGVSRTEIGRTFSRKCIYNALLLQIVRVKQLLNNYTA